MADLSQLLAELQGRTQQNYEAQRPDLGQSLGGMLMNLGNIIGESQKQGREERKLALDEKREQGRADRAEQALREKQYQFDAQNIMNQQKFEAQKQQFQLKLSQQAELAKKKSDLMKMLFNPTITSGDKANLQKQSSLLDQIEELSQKSLLFESAGMDPTPYQLQLGLLQNQLADVESQLRTPKTVVTTNGTIVDKTPKDPQDAAMEALRKKNEALKEKRK